MNRQEKWLTDEQQYALTDLSASLGKLRIIESRMNQLFPGNSMELYNKRADKDPDNLLKIQNSLIRMKEVRLEYLEDTYSDFINLLDVYGKLAEAPLRNYLSPELESI